MLSVSHHLSTLSLYLYRHHPRLLFNVISPSISILTFPQSPKLPQFFKNPNFLSKIPINCVSMATHLLTFRPTGIRACAIPAHPKPDPNRRKSNSSSSSANWFAPLFGWSSEPDYIDSDNENEAKEKREGESEKDLGQKQAKSKFSPGCFTEEKARQLRMMTTNTSSFHDAMYHSAIASRLASDFKDRSDV